MDTSASNRPLARERPFPSTPIYCRRRSEPGIPDRRRRARGDGPITMTVGLFTALLIAAIFIGILWNVGGDLIIGVLGHVLTVPKYLVIAVAL
jgi:hypothetical protein